MVITDETGAQSCYSLGQGHDQANRRRLQVQALSSRYSADTDAEWDIDVLRIEPWPGIRQLKRQARGE